MKSGAEVMEMLEAYDLTGSTRSAAALVGCSHHTVARYVAAREAGQPRPVPSPSRSRVIDEFMPKIEEWVDRSRGRIRADKAHERLVAMGYAGSERTTRRAVAEAKSAWRDGHRRVHRPWVAEPGLWVQYDFGDGPLVDGAKTVLFCAWVAWSRFRVVLALRDKTQASVLAALDTVFRRIGGVPTYVLTDNEKTVTVEHVAGLPVRHPVMVEFGKHYGVTVKTCLPADPASKGGTEATVRIAKADLVPTATNLAAGYASMADLHAACEAFCEKVNHRVHRVTRRVPGEMLAEERQYLHPVPQDPHTVVLGLTRRVPVNTPMVTFEHCQYSVPHQLCGQTVWVRSHDAAAGRQVVIVHVGPAGPVEVARHQVGRPGSPRIDDAHFPAPVGGGALDRRPRARTGAEQAFLAIGPGAAVWLGEATAAGTSRIRVKMAAAVDLATLMGADRVDWALGHAAVHHRFAEADLGSILAYHNTLRPAGTTAGTNPATGDRQDTRRVGGQGASLAQGTTGWAKFTGSPCCRHVPKVAQ